MREMYIYIYKKNELDWIFRANIKCVMIGLFSRLPHKIVDVWTALHYSADLCQGME